MLQNGGTRTATNFTDNRIKAAYKERGKKKKKIQFNTHLKINKRIRLTVPATVMNLRSKTSGSHQPCPLASLKKVFPFLVKLPQSSETVPVVGITDLI